MAENSYRQTIETPSDRVILALDDMTFNQAQVLTGQTDGLVGLVKMNSLAQRRGWAASIGMVTELSEGRTLVMADAKFHDIPKTVELSVKDVASCGAALITVHASGGSSMLRAAVEGRDRGVESIQDTFLQSKKERLGGILGITILTSLGGEDCFSIYGEDPESKVIQFAYMALDAGIDGVVCSGRELRAIRSLPALDGLLTVIPGITPQWARKAGDQKRVVTPTEAIESGADYIVVGRAITQPPEGIIPFEAAQRVALEVSEAL